MWPFDCPDNELREYVEHLREHVAAQGQEIERLKAYLGQTDTRVTHTVPVAAREGNVVYPQRWTR